MTKHSLSALVAASLFSHGLPTTSASAAELPGSCCADLEERVAELEATATRKGNRKLAPISAGPTSQGTRSGNTSRFMAVASAAFILFVAAAASGQAQAQNYDGSGQLRFGAFAQGSQLDFDVQRPVAAAGTASIDGLGGGASFGYDWVLKDSLVFGLEADASVEDGDDTINKRTANNTRSLSFSPDYLVTLRGRLGAHLRPGWLVYATGGAALLGVEYQRPFTTSTEGAVTRTDLAIKISDTLTGWTVGGGTEIDLEGVMLFAEYLHAGFDTWEFKDSVRRVSTQHEVDVDEHLVRLGVKFKIGHDYYHDDVRRDRLK